MGVARMIRPNRQPEIGLGVRVWRQAGGVVLEVIGEVDLATEGRFLAALEQAVDNRANAFVVDLRAVTFLSVVGLRHLVAVDAVAGDGVIRLVPSPVVRRVIELAGVAQLLTIKHTVAEALEDGP
jgi:anti-anti-sigma factor